MFRRDLRTETPVATQLEELAVPSPFSYTAKTKMGAAMSRSLALQKNPWKRKGDPISMDTGQYAKQTFHPEYTGSSYGSEFKPDLTVFAKL